MQVRIEPHTLQRALERGASETEIIQTIEFGNDIPAKAGRLARAMIFSYDQERNGKFYDQKKLEVYYIIEHETIITVTVYVFFGNFRESNIIDLIA